VCGKSWTGSAFGGTRGRTQLPKYVNAYLENRPPFVNEFVTFTLPHTEVNEAFHLMHEGKSLRSVITFPHKNDAEVATHRAAHHPKSAIVFLHGLGDVPASWQGSVEWLGSKVGPNCLAVCPAAPVLPITKNGGETMPAWCDVFEPWPLIPSSKDDSAGLSASVSAIHAVLDGLVADGVPAERIIVAGFSQGAATATLSTYTYPKKLAGCINLSGWLPNRDTFAAQLRSENSSTPLFWGHGTQDDVVAFANQAVGVETLSASGISVTAKQYEIGHDSNEDEFADLLHFIHYGLSTTW
jgi:predicted esterase